MTLRNFLFFKPLHRKFSSALYITGDKAQKSFSALTPVVDFDTQLKKKSELQRNIALRKLQIDIDKVEERWKFFKDIEYQKNILEQTKSKIGQSLYELTKQNKENKVDDEIEKLRLHLKVIKEDLKNIKEVSYSIEEGANLQVLDLPNDLHSKTPTDSELELFRYLEKIDIGTESHINIGEHKNYLKFINPMSVFLKSDASLFEFGVQNYFVNELLHFNYVEFSNSDFVKSIVVEGCGTNPYDNSEVLTLETIHCVTSDDINRLHLVGASSLYSFMAYFTKHMVQKSLFPLKLFCVGRKYQTVEENTSKTLFNLNQSSNIEIFIANTETFNLEHIVNDVVTLYKQLGYHFRVVLKPAYDLKKAESLRISIQMFSNHLGSYVEVGYVSFYEDYISKRLLFNYTQSNERKYPFIAGGSLINIHKFLGCVLENNSIDDRKLLTDLLSNYIC
ncbi:serine--tRNA synthetase-like protein Slimp isoform X1 [Sitophilus oryzae]|uniref:Serine--tRNA synthetase-like protein Slimp isoform X1 n=1 Tax=Sitophilus oryzae TaxID=7048 RepID=A0A6J2X899_SITOR|nr:serine--tRNA synthetase-like protein Slimp isoform X1 [Sitophilus oryzae]